jgi:ABC-type nickel/cobalt efflux system permease component RcnA
MEWLDLHVWEERLSLALTADTPGSVAAIFLLGIALGAFHSLLPGHGKTLLATHHASSTAGESKAAGALSSLRDGMVIAFMRVGMAALLVWSGLEILDFFTGAGDMRTGLIPHPNHPGHEDHAHLYESHGHDDGTAHGIVGVMFIALGAWIAFSAWRHRRQQSIPVFLFGLVPDPMTVTFLLAASVVGASATGLLAIFGIAVGMATTLTLSALGGERLKRLLVSTTETRRERIEQVLGLGGGALVVALGAVLLLNSLT